MFDIGATELLVIAVVAIIIVGPKDLPILLRKIGHLVSYGKKLSSDFKTTLNDVVEESGVKDVPQTIDDVVMSDNDQMDEIDDEFFSDISFGDDEVVTPEINEKPVKKSRKKNKGKKSTAETADIASAISEKV